MPFDTSFFRMNNIFSPDTNIGDYGSESGVDDLVYRKKKINPYSVTDTNSGDSIASNLRDRLSNAFAPTAQMQPDPVSQPAQVENPDDIYMRRFKEMTDTSGPAQEEYRKFIDTMPQREDYRPGKMRSFAAALAGGAAGFKDPGKGIAIAEHLRDQPYESAIQDFSLKAKGKQEAAQEERQSLTARRQLFNDVLTDRQRQALLPSQVAKNTGQANQAEASAADTRAKTGDRPAELEIKRTANDAKIELNDALTQLRLAQANGTPALIAAATERANAAMIAANAATVNAQANTTRAGAAVETAHAATTRANTKPTFESYNTPEDIERTKKDAVKNVITKNSTKYYGFGEADKQGNLTGGAKPYQTPSGIKSAWQTDRSADYQSFLREVAAEQQRLLKAGARKRKVGTTSDTSPNRGVATVSDIMNSFDQQ